MDNPIVKIASWRRLESPRRKAGLAAVALGCLTLAACLQTEPGVDPAAPEMTLIEDKERRAGASSSTNWPAEFGNTGVYKVFWSADTALTFRFTELRTVFPGNLVPISRSGRFQIFRYGTIPALDSVAPVEAEFSETDTLAIPFSHLESLGNTQSDTVAFNLRIQTDSLQAWFLGFYYSKKEKKIIQTPFSIAPGSSVTLSIPKYFFQGVVSDILALLPPATGKNPEFSFYIPGTPEFCKAQQDSFKVGPLSHGQYPLRVIRASHSEDASTGTLVEAWELKVSGIGQASVFTLGNRVLSFRAEGRLNLRSE